MNESLHESANLMEMLTDSMPGMVGYWTKELRSVFANREYLNWLGKRAEEIRDAAMRDVLGEALFRTHEPYILAALAGKLQTFDYTLTLPNDETKETLVHYIPHREGCDVLGLFVLTFDLTERKSLEQALISAAEERQRLIGRELHDNLGQQIAAIAYQAKALERKLLISGSVDEAKIATSMAAQAQHAVMQCKHLSRGLHPLELETNTLTDALHAFASGIATTYGISCDFVCPDKIVIDNIGLAPNLYRIAQEAIHNAIVHGAARQLTISLETRNRVLRLSICDDGCGFSGVDSDREVTPGMGIKIMQHRATQMGATLKLLSRKAGGTEVLVEKRLC